MKLTSKIAAVVLAVCLAVSLCACGSDTTWISEYAGTTLPAGVYNLYLTAEYSNALSKVASDVEIKDIYKADVEGTPLNEAVTAAAKEDIREHYAVLKMFDDMGLSLSESELLGIEAQADSMWGDGKSYEAHGVARSSLTAYLEAVAKRGAIFKAIYGPGGEKEISEADLKAAFDDTYYAAMYVARATIDTSTGEPLDSAALKENTDYLEGLKKRADEGADFFELVLEDETKKLEANGQDTSSLKDVTANDFTYIVEKTNTVYFPAEMMTALGEMKNDEVRMVTASSMNILLKKLDLLSIQEAYDARVDTLRNSLKGEEFNTMISEAASAIEPSFNEKSLSRYTAKSLNLGE